MQIGGLVTDGGDEAAAARTKDMKVQLADLDVALQHARARFGRQLVRVMRK